MAINLKKVLQNFTFSIFFLLLTNDIFAQPALPVGYGVNTPVNYVRTWDAMAPIQNEITLLAAPSRDVRTTTQYIDGLGRPMQLVVKKGSLATGSDSWDLVSSAVFDPFSRESIKYLPYAATNDNSGLFKSNPFITQNNFYNTQLEGQTEETGFTNNLNWAFNQTNFENSPLNRIQESFSPGVNWAGTSEMVSETNRHSVKAKNWINTLTDNVKIWKVTNEASMNIFGNYNIDITNNNGKYAAGQLFKTVTIDEHGKQVIEFKDKEGKVILKKVQIGTTTGIEDDGAGRGYDGWLSTYYIYDDLNNLRCVIQPEGVNALNLNVNNAPALTTLLLNEQCFRYEYDNRNRMIMKKVPGAGEVYMVYDKRDRLVMTQDANMRYASTEKWLITKYDELNRPKETGMWQNGSTNFETHLSAANSSTIDYPTTSPLDYETLTYTHYDDYTGLPAGLTAYDYSWNNTNYFSATSNTFPYEVMPEVSFATKGMVTWTQVKVLGTTTFLNTVTYYDAKGRPIQVQSTNLTGGTDLATTQYSWAGLPLVMINKQQKAGTNAQENLVITKMQYDDLGRVISVKKKVKASINTIEKTTPEVEIAKYEYDQLGQLKTKYIGKKKDANGSYTTTPLESLQYDYNIRGWLLGMNRNYVSSTGQNSNNKFGFELGYDKVSNVAGRNFLGAGLFNGNISGMIWKSDGDDVKRKYDFSYDAANRLLKGQFEQEDGKASWNNTTMDYGMQMGNGSDHTSAYDANGNIIAMKQYGWKLGDPTALIDNLSYSYFAGTNRLQAVTDAITADNKMGDFTDKNTTTTDYGYDKNGNLVTDLNKRLNGTTGSELNSGGAIVYNYLNLPESIAVKKDDGFDKGTITYTYDAAGNKLKKEVGELGQPTKTTLYLGGQIYENDALQFIGMEEGRVRPIFNASNQLTSFAFDYMIKDHLGNVRMVLTDEQKPNMYPSATMEVATINDESIFYENLSNTQVAKPSWFNDPLYSTNNKVAKVKNESGSQKVGPNLLMKVMAGDTYNIRVTSGWSSGSSSINNNTNVLSSLLSLLSGSITTASGGKASQLQLENSSSGLGTGLNSFVANQTNPISTKPRAYLSWVLLDEQFKVVKDKWDNIIGDGYSGFDQVGESGTTKEHVMSNLTVNKSGYLYIYVSNESTNIDVFFDNLQVSHNSGSILEETHYYPFGLTMSGISSSAEGKLENKIKFQEQELASKEFSDGSGLEMYEFKWRMHDPQTGRFWQIDPLADKYAYNSTYAFSENHVTSHRELEGLEKVLAIFFHGGPFGEGKTTTPDKAGGTGTIFNDTKQFAESTGKGFAGTVIAPGWNTDNSVATANEFINSNYEKGDEIIIYGYSYGGDAAVELSQSLKKDKKNVGLLVTVDNSDGLVGLALNSSVDTKVSSNVETNLNVYQDKSTAKTKAKGGPNTAEDDKKTNVVNRNVSAPGTDHGNIQEKNKELIQSVINYTIQLYNPPKK